MSLLQDSLKDRIDRFFTGQWYIFSLLLLSIAAHLLSLELVAYTFFALIAVYVCLIGNDFLPIVPLLVFSYIIPSANNNPGKTEASVFYSDWFFWIALTVVLSFLIFFVRNIKRLFTCKRKLIMGMGLLCVGYLLSGIGSTDYTSVAGKNLFFAALQGLCLILPYFFLSGGINWSKVRKEYLAWIGVCAGVLLVVEVLWSYINGGVIVEGVINRKMIFTGWGMYNNLGAMLAMMIPFSFALGAHYKKSWLGIVVGLVFTLGTIMTCSRTSLTAAVCIYIFCALAVLFYGHSRKKIFMVLLGVVSAVLLAVLLLHKELLQLYSLFLKKITDPSSRHILFSEGWKVFREAPLFGSSFFSPGYQPWDFATVDTFTALFPPRWHNTIVQLLASCGIVGLITYGFHRFQTIRLFFQRKGYLRACIGCSIVVLLACCLLDCHFFNGGPVLFYSVQLAFLEFVPTTTQEK